MAEFRSERALREISDVSQNVCAVCGTLGFLCDVGTFAVAEYEIVPHDQRAIGGIVVSCPCRFRLLELLEICDAGLPARQCSPVSVDFRDDNHGNEGNYGNEDQDFDQCECGIVFS